MRPRALYLLPCPPAAKGPCSFPFAPIRFAVLWVGCKSGLWQIWKGGIVSTAENKQVSPADEAVPEYLKSSYRWVIILIYGIANFAPIICTYSFMGMGVVIQETFRIASQDFSRLSTIGFLTGFFFSLPFGGLTDRFGARRMMGVAYLIATLAIGARLVFPMSAGMLTVTQFFVGFSFCAVNSTAVKTISSWFCDREYSIMMGVFIGVATLGAAVGMAAGGIFTDAAGLEVLLRIQFGVVAVVWVLCMLLIRNRPQGAPEVHQETFVKYIGTTLKYREIWIVSICYLLLYGAVTTCMTFLVTALQAEGVEATTASLVAIIVNVIALFGELIMPPLVLKGKKRNWTRLALAIMALVVAACLLIGTLSGNTTVFIVIVSIGFFAVGGCLALQQGLPGQIPRLPRECLGSAGGFHTSLQNLGAFVVPTYFVAAIAGSNYTLLWILTAVVFVLAAVCYLIMPKDVGAVAEVQKDDKQ